MESLHDMQYGNLFNAMVFGALIHRTSMIIVLIIHVNMSRNVRNASKSSYAFKCYQITPLFDERWLIGNWGLKIRF